MHKIIEVCVYIFYTYINAIQNIMWRSDFCLVVIITMSLALAQSTFLIFVILSSTSSYNYETNNDFKRKEIKRTILKGMDFFFVGIRNNKRVHFENWNGCVKWVLFNNIERMRNRTDSFLKRTLKTLHCTYWSIIVICTIVEITFVMLKQKKYVSLRRNNCLLSYKHLK